MAMALVQLWTSACRMRDLQGSTLGQARARRPTPTRPQAAALREAAAAARPHCGRLGPNVRNTINEGRTDGPRGESDRKTQEARRACKRHITRGNEAPGRVCGEAIAARAAEGDGGARAHGALG